MCSALISIPEKANRLHFVAALIGPLEISWDPPDAYCVIPKKALENVIAPIANGSAKATTGEGLCPTV